MNRRAVLYDLVARYRLDAVAAHRLWDLAGLDGEPDGLAARLPRGVAVFAGALVGLGVVLWVAANWDSLGRVGQFGVLQGLVLVMSLGALALPRARPSLGLVAMLGIGGLLAYFGQTYQTGADPWQLFALWAGLCLPLCLAIRSDVVWAPWALVAMTAVALSSQVGLGSLWTSRVDHLTLYPQSWAIAVVLCAGLSGPLRPLTGAGIWALRTAVTLAVVLVTFSALGGLIAVGPGSRYWLGVLVLGTGAGLLALPRGFDVGSLSAVVLGLNTLVVSGLGYWLLDGTGRHEPIGELLILGLAAAGLLAASVSGVLKLVRYHAGATPGRGADEGSRDSVAGDADHE